MKIEHTTFVGQEAITKDKLKEMIQKLYPVYDQELETITGIIFRALQNESTPYNNVEDFVHYKMEAFKYPTLQSGKKTSETSAQLRDVRQTNCRYLEELAKAKEEE